MKFDLGHDDIFLSREKVLESLQTSTEIWEHVLRQDLGKLKGHFPQLLCAVDCCSVCKLNPRLMDDHKP